MTIKIDEQANQQQNLGIISADAILIFLQLKMTKYYPTYNTDVLTLYIREFSEQSSLVVQEDTSNDLDIKH
jgi:hypothetical protein